MKHPGQASISESCEDVSLNYFDGEVKITQVKQCGIRGVNGYHAYFITTKLRETNEDAKVWRRYSQFEELHKWLGFLKPGCPLPYLPEKNPTLYVFAADSTEVQNRKTGLEQFLERTIDNPHLCNSPALRTFLTNPEPKYDSQEFDLQYLLEPESKFSTWYSFAAGMFTGSEGNKRKELLGEFSQQAEEAIAPFSKKQCYLNELCVTFKQLEETFSQHIQSLKNQCDAETSTADSFAHLQKKEAKQIYYPFTQSVKVNHQLIESIRNELLGPAKDYRLNIEACLQAFIRIKAITSRVYELLNLIAIDELYLSKQGHSLDAGSKNDLTNKIERHIKEKAFTKGLLDSNKHILEEYFQRIQEGKQKTVEDLAQTFRGLLKQAAEQQTTNWQQFIA